MMEELQAHNFKEIYADYGPGSGNNTFGVTYKVEGKTFPLEPYGGGNAGSLIFCVDETAIPTDFDWVGFYDLNGDTDVADTDVTTDYKVLPVIVRITWDDGGRDRTNELKTVLFGPKYDY